MTPEQAVADHLEKAHHVAGAEDALGGLSRPVAVREVVRKLQMDRVRTFLFCGLILIAFAGGIALAYSAPWPISIRIGVGVVLGIPFLLLLALVSLGAKGSLRRSRNLIRGLETFGVDTCPICGKNTAEEVACCDWQASIGSELGDSATFWIEFSRDSRRAIARLQRLEGSEHAMTLWPFQSDGTNDSEHAVMWYAKWLSLPWLLLKILAGVGFSVAFTYLTFIVGEWIVALVRAKLGW